MTQLSRRSLITGLISLVAAPAIVRAGSLMPVKQMIEPVRFAVGPVYVGERWFWVKCLEPTIIQWSVVHPTQWDDLH